MDTKIKDSKSFSKALPLKMLLGIFSAVLVLVVSFFIPGGEMLTTAGIRVIGIIVAFLLLLITEAMPITVICWTTLAVMPLVGAVESFPAALSGFSNQVVFFILASFGIAAGFTTIPLSKRMMVALLRRFGKSVSSMLLSMMACSALVSSIVSNVPTCAIFMAIGLSFLELYDDKNEKKRAGRAFMIGIPVSSMVGGMMTPAGSSINLLAIGLLEQFTGETITFAQWMAVGIPLTLMILPIAWILIVKVYKPPEIKAELVKDFIEDLDVPQKLESKEKKMLVITACMLALWILSSWIREINVMVVALLGCCVLFFPGIRVLEWKSFARDLNFDSFFLVGTVLSIGAAMVNNGVSGWIITLLPTVQVSAPAVVALTVAVVFLMLVIIPVAPSLVTLMATPLIALASSMGYNPAMVILTLGLCAANCYLLPLDTVTLITYGTGYYSMLDMPKSTLPLQVIIVAIMAIWIPIASRLLGIL